MKKIYTLIAISCLFNSFATGQEIPISNATVTGCAGFLVDTGLSQGDYGPNEDITMTICADDGETYINLGFNLFNLGEGDFLTIYDGDSDLAPLLGVYGGIDLQQIDVTSTDENPTACLTLHWESDGSDEGSFGAAISCGLPCIKPLAVVEFEGEIPLLVCPGDEITLDASPTVFAEGTAVGTWEWNYGDLQTNSTDWPVTTHSFDEEGAYKIQLYITDDNGCSSTNVIDVLVFVSNEPIIEIISEPAVCLGAELDIAGIATPVTWSAIPNGLDGGDVFIPDDQGECFGSTITYNIFNAGATIEEVGDIENFFVNFEHSFMGDLTITFICPNGQSITVHEPSGGGTYLGEPVDVDGTPNEAGIGYDYWWAPDATNGTWGEESGGTTLASGTYQSDGPWENLVGCPLNGVWEIEICDTWASDNGFIFNWTVEMDPSLYPEDLSFTPSIGTDCDSTFWTGPNIISTSANCSDITILPTESGTLDYVFTAVNNHGCSFEETITINVVEVLANAGDDITLCGDDIFLDGSAITLAPFNNIIYEWTPAGGLSAGDIPGPQVTDLTETTTYTLNVYPDGFPECANEDDTQVIIEDVAPLEALVEDMTSPCPGTDVVLTAVAVGGNPNYTIIWNPGGEGESITVNPLVDTSYDVTIIDACGFAASGTVNVVVAQPGTEITADGGYACINGVGQIINLNGGTGNYTFTYDTDSLEVYPQFGNQEYEFIGYYEGNYDIFIEDDCLASGIVEVTAEVCVLIIPNIFTPNNDGVNDGYVIDGIGSYPGSVVKIYNRWGKLMHESEDYSREIWRPTDAEVSEGTYYYVIDLVHNSGRIEQFEGHITVVIKK
ncbi:MAG: gliding motility-associated-like protein [Litorivivens sp.]|jgi:gliding motility-associated-like protein